MITVDGARYQIEVVRMVSTISQGAGSKSAVLSLRPFPPFLGFVTLP